MYSKKLLKLILFLALLLSIVFSGLFLSTEFTVEEVRKILSKVDSNIFAPVIFISVYAVGVVLFLPGAILTISGGFIFGPVYGTLYNIIGAVTGATLAFLISRYLAADWVSGKIKGKLKVLKEGLEQQGWRFLAIVRLTPILPFNAMNYALGLTNVSVITYVVASGIFMLPGCFIYTYLGSVGEIFLNGENYEIINHILLGIGVVILLFCVPWLVKLLRK